MRGWSFRHWDKPGAPYRVGVETGLLGVCLPGEAHDDGLTTYGGQPMASAVMDDFGNLVVVGFWR